VRVPVNQRQLLYRIRPIVRTELGTCKLFFLFFRPPQSDKVGASPPVQSTTSRQ